MTDIITEILYNDTLVLTPQMACHAGTLFEVLQPSQIYEFLDEDVPTDFAAFEARLKRLETRCSPDGAEHWLNWVVYFKGEMAGYIQATIYPDHTCEISYVLSPLFWGQGIANQAINAMLQHVIEHHDIESFFAQINAQNARSVGLVQRLGFEQVTHDAAEMKFEKTISR